MSVYQLTTKGVWQGQACYNMYLWYHPGMTTQILEDTWGNFGNAWVLHMQPRQSDQYSIPEYSWRRVDAPGYPEVTNTVVGALVGDGVGDVTASYDTVVASMRSGTLRPNRARKYFGGWNEASMTGGRWITAVTDAVAGFVQALIDTWDDGGGELAQWVTGRWGVNPGDPPDTPPYVIAHNPLGFYTVSDNPSALHSRRLGVGI